MSELRRCSWADSHPLNLAYHDAEWGVPLHDDRALFELLILEGAQAGLSWLTVLKKRDEYRSAFDNFDAERIARYTDKKIVNLLANPGIIRNKAKIQATVGNARALIQLQDALGSFDSYLWGFVNNKSVQGRWKLQADVPAKTALSDALSKDLVDRGFKFVGSTICYSFMQATGMINDHLINCFRRNQVTHHP